ncbi:MAG: hypothetical protein ACOYXM_12125 [Actinomycetota bacterium]
MEPTAERLLMYGRPGDVEPLEWSWVHDQLTAAGTYWIAAPSDGHPHPRPVWGVWQDRSLHLRSGAR